MFLTMWLFHFHFHCTTHPIAFTIPNPDQCQPDHKAPLEFVSFDRFLSESILTPAKSLIEPYPLPNPLMVLRETTATLLVRYFTFLYPTGGHVISKRRRPKSWISGRSTTHQSLLQNVRTLHDFHRRLGQSIFVYAIRCRQYDGRYTFTNKR